MSGSQWPPPPGGVPTSEPAPPGWVAAAAAPPPGWAPQPGMLGAAHKPGALPLRPLGLGDIYDAAFKIIRFNPKATVGSAVLVASAAMALPLLITAALTWSVGLALDGSQNAMLAGALTSGVVGLGTVLRLLGTILVTGMLAHVTAAAAVGRRLSLGEAWAATRGKRWRLIGLTLLLSLLLVLIVAAYVGLLLVVVVLTDGALIPILWGVLSFLGLFLPLVVWFYIRVAYLPVPALMLEDVGLFGAIGRGYRLTRRQFWRTFGIAALTAVVAGIGGGLLATPVTIGGQVAILAVGAQYVVLGSVLAQGLSSVVSTAFTAPFSAAVTSLQYLDQRMRKEAYDVELMQQAGIISR